MAADALKSASITNLDATPVTPNSPGEGGIGVLRDASDYVTPTTGGLGNTSSKYKMCRVPSNAKIKAIELYADGALDTSTGLVLDVGAYWSDSTVDGTSSANQGTSISAACFCSQTAAFQSSAVAKVDALTAYSSVKRNQPLWSALSVGASEDGTTIDPGGFIDIVVAVHTGASSAASHNLGMLVRYVI